MGVIFKALGQPTVIGEILAGILLGPSGLGQPYPCPTGGIAKTSLYPLGAPCDSRNPTLVLFPTAGGGLNNYLAICAQLGIVVFMFVVGIEVDMDMLRKSSTKATIIAVFSVATPFLLAAFVLGPWLYERHSTANGAPVSKIAFQLCVGTSMSVTALPVLARVITEKKLHKLSLGTMTLGCAAINDVVAWSLLAIVLAVQKSQKAALATASGPTQIGYKGVIKELGLVIAVVVGEFFIVGPLLRLTVFNAYKRTGNLSSNRLAWALVGLFLSAWLLHQIGFETILGAFVYGLVFPRGKGTAFLYSILARVEAFAVIVLLPIFFIVTGLSINLSQMSEPGAGEELGYVLLVAIGGKFLGSAVLAKLTGSNWRHSGAVGVLMNTRGLTEIVVLNIVKSVGILDDLMFTILVLMAIITTAMAGPCLSIFFTSKRILAETQAELKAKARAKGPPVVRPSPGAPPQRAARLVVLVHDVARGERLLEAAVSTLLPGMAAFLDVAMFTSPGDHRAESTELGGGLLRSPDEAAAEGVLKAQLAAVCGQLVTGRVTVASSSDTVEAALLHIRARDPQLVVTDWPAGEEERARLQRLVVASPCGVVLWGGAHGLSSHAPHSPDEAAPTPPSPLLPGEIAGGGAKRATAGGDDGAPPSPHSPGALVVPRAAAKPPTHHPLRRALTAERAGRAHAGASSAPQTSPLHTLSPPPPPPPRATPLRALLYDADAQDAAAAAAGARLAAAFPLTLGPKAAAPSPDDDGDDDDDDTSDGSGGGGGGGEGDEEAGGWRRGAGAPAPPSAPGVAAAHVVATPASMAMAAAQALSPKFSKLMITGWPVDDAGCAALLRFLRAVEAAVLARKASHAPAARRAPPPPPPNLLRRRTLDRPSSLTRRGTPWAGGVGGGGGGGGGGGFSPPVASPHAIPPEAAAAPQATPPRGALGGGGGGGWEQAAAVAPDAGVWLSALSEQLALPAIEEDAGTAQTPEAQTPEARQG